MCADTFPPRAQRGGPLPPVTLPKVTLPIVTSATASALAKYPRELYPSNAGRPTMATMTPEEMRRILVRVGRRLIRQAHGREAAERRITVLVVAGEQSVVTSDEPTPPATVPPPIAELAPLQRDIMAALTVAPRGAKAIAKDAGRPYNSSFRQAIAALVEMGHARRTRSGICRP